jgi:hypothetical protein
VGSGSGRMCAGAGSNCSANRSMTRTSRRPTTLPSSPSCRLRCTGAPVQIDGVVTFLVQDCAERLVGESGHGLRGSYPINEGPELGGPDGLCEHLLDRCCAFSHADCLHGVTAFLEPTVIAIGGRLISGPVRDSQTAVAEDLGQRLDELGADGCGHLRLLGHGRHVCGGPRLCPRKRRGSAHDPQGTCSLPDLRQRRIRTGPRQPLRSASLFGGKLKISKSLGAALLTAALVAGPVCAATASPAAVAIQASPTASLDLFKQSNRQIVG